MLNKYLILLTSSLFNLAGTTLIFGLFSSLFLSNSTTETIKQLLFDEQLAYEIYCPLIQLFVGSALVWTMGVLLIKNFGKQQRKTLKRSTGAIATETLIILPIFFLLTSGLAQLAMNQMAGLLTTVGAYEAGRIVALWGPEIGNNRFQTVSIADVQERARVAAAAIVTPVARDNIKDGRCEPTQVFDDFAAGMEASGIASQNLADAGSQLSISSYAQAFGGSNSFYTRAPKKLRSAYCSVTISDTFQDIPNSGLVGEDFEVTVTYDHAPVFPLVDKIFGTSAIERTYTLRSHIPPNTKIPKG